MKRLNDLKKQLPSSAKLNNFEFTRVKGGADKKSDRTTSTVTSVIDPIINLDRPSFLGGGG